MSFLKDSADGVEFGKLFHHCGTTNYRREDSRWQYRCLLWWYHEFLNGVVLNEEVQAGLGFCSCCFVSKCRRFEFNDPVVVLHAQTGSV